MLLWKDRLSKFSVTNQSKFAFTVKKLNALTMTHKLQLFMVCFFLLLFTLLTNSLHEMLMCCFDHLCCHLKSLIALMRCKCAIGWIIKIWMCYLYVHKQEERVFFLFVCQISRWDVNQWWKFEWWFVEFPSKFAWV